MIILEDDQEVIIEKVRQSFASGHKHPLLQSATGSGKTVMASYIINNANKKGITTWFLVPRRQLLLQTEKTYNKFGMAYGLIAAEKRYMRKQLNYICSTQTITRRLDTLEAPKLAIIDETHYGGKDLDRIITWLKNNDSKIIGLTATPKKMNGKAMGDWYDDLILGLPMPELIRLNRLSDYEIYAPNIPDLTGIKITAGNYNKKSLNEYMQDHGKVLIGDAIKTYKEKAYGKIGVVYSTSVEESKKIVTEFEKNGVPTAHMDSETSDEVRTELINKLADREILLLCNVDLLTFGFDLAAQVNRDVNIECMIDLAPTKSEPKQLQKWGRVLRYKKYPAQIFDHVGNVFEHGDPKADREWTLKGQEKKNRKQQAERTVTMKQCPNCYFCHIPAPSCPSCKHVYPIIGRTLDTEDGELEKYNPDWQRIIEQEKMIKKKNRMEIGRARTMADLKKIAQNRGYSPGWVYKMASIKKIKN